MSKEYDKRLLTDSTKDYSTYGRVVYKESVELDNCAGDTLLPFFKQEQGISRAFRIFLYFGAMLQFFIGIAISSNQFMDAIEQICATTKRIQNNETKEQEEVIIWNETLANLTLLAFGSSSPEIILAVYEAIATGFSVSELGPGTIIGSASFNLMMITAVCIMAVPDRDEELGDYQSEKEHFIKDKEKGQRKIEQQGVFIITSINSILAYVWIVVITAGSSPNVIDIWEGVVTFLFYPLMLVLSYCQDKNWFAKNKENKIRGQILDQGGSTKQNLNSNNLTTEDYNMLQNKNKFKSFKRMFTKKNESDAINIEFKVSEIDCQLSQGEIDLKIIRQGNTTKFVGVDFKTEDGSAKSGDHYMKQSGQIRFGEDQIEAVITIKLIKNNEINSDELDFTVSLFDPKLLQKHQDNDEKIQINPQNEEVIVRILNDNTPCCIEFDSINAIINSDMNTVRVLKKGECKEEIKIGFKIISSQAIYEKDIEKIEDCTLTFSPEDEQKDITLKILKESDYNSRNFLIELFLLETTTQYKIGNIDTCTANITKNEKLINISKKLNKDINNLEEEDEDNSQFGQIVSSMKINADDEENITKFDLFCHFVSFNWKVICAFIPNKTYKSGYPTFVVSLIVIAIQSAFTADMAKMLGCVLGVGTYITAIAFVALGTSIPDTFASKISAETSSTADGAIGNVTGSNSCNVYLGLGLPQLIGSIQHKANGTIYKVKSEGMAEGVLTYFVLATVLIGLLTYRRHYCFGELGGPRKSKIISAVICVALQIIFLIASFATIK